MKFNPRRRLSRIRSLLIKSVLSFVLFTTLVVLLLRFVHPPFSFFMVHQKIRSLFSHGKSVQIQYQWVDMKDVSPFVPLAVMASEDQGFLNHHGFDFTAMGKAVKNNLRHPRRIRGGSTLSQQTAKNLFLWSTRSYLRKAVEAYFTGLMELLWPKRRILEVYLNIAEFGQGIYGVGAASRSFYNKPPAKLTPMEASLLAAVLPSPKRYNAKNPSGFVIERSEWIETQMDRMGGLAAVKDLTNR